LDEKKRGIFFLIPGVFKRKKPTPPKNQKRGRSATQGIGNGRAKEKVLCTNAPSNADAGRRKTGKSSKITPLPPT